MAAALFDFEFQQGSTFVLDFVWMDVNEQALSLEGHIVRMQVRPYPGAKKLFLEASTLNGKFILGAERGTFKLVLSATETASFDWAKGKYDIEIEAPDGFVTKLLQGTITIIREVTQ